MRKRLMVLFILPLFMAAGCGKAAEETGGKVDNNPTQEADNGIATNDPEENTEKTEEQPVEEENTTEPEVSLKEEYLQKLADTKKAADELVAPDTSTYALKKVEDDRWELWDGLLNEVYAVLKEQLPSDEMEQLREEQRNWIKFRDESALEASSKYKGGTQEHLEYSAVSANLTEERCYELVEKYMK